jgi:tryptophanyl-tRNA synthetase
LTTYLSGIQSSGLLHLGNWFGAMRPHIALQELEGEHFYFIADYHALTTSRDPERLRQEVREAAVAYLAMGLDPERVTLWRQSDVPAVTEIAWMLSCVTGMGLLERAHSYKDKIAKGIKANVGLFTYPALMAADILAYDSTHVPVGADQKQHVEMTQDMAASFNAAFGAEVFQRPEPLIEADERLAKVVGTDGQKMSKSYGNTIWLFETGKKLKKAVNQITTDSRPPEDPKDPADVLLFRFLELFLEPAELEEWEGRVREGGADAPGYGHLKARLIELIEETFREGRARRQELLDDPGEVDRVLASGAQRARERASLVRDRALKACGLR